MQLSGVVAAVALRSNLAGSCRRRVRIAGLGLPATLPATLLPHLASLTQAPLPCARAALHSRCPLIDDDSVTGWPAE